MDQEILLEQVTKVLRNRTVLDHIDLALPAGELYGFFGRNGSGKTMLLRAIAGLITVEGSICVLGKEITKDHSFPGDLGLMIERTELWPQYSAMDNLRLLAGIRQVIGEDEMENALLRVGLNPDDKRPIRAYSLGMRQKLALAQAIMEKPRLLLLDEPTSGLDEASLAMFRVILREELERGCTILVATHQREDVAGLCRRSFRLSEGRIKEEAL